MQTITLGYGKANFSNASATLVAFHVEPPFVRGLASRVFPKRSGTIRVPVSEHEEIGGSLYLDALAVPDGTILQVQMRESRRGAPIREGAIFIKIRGDGAAMMISANIPADARSLLLTNSHAMFVGSGDILTKKALANEGIILPPSFSKTFMVPAEIDECFDVTILHEAIAEAPREEKHVSPKGDVVVLKIESQRRRIRIRR